VTFEVPVSAISRSRGRGGTVAVVGLAALIVATGLIAGLWNRDPGADVQAPAVAPFLAAADGDPAASGLAPARPAAIPRIPTPSIARELPDRVQCHDVGRGRCERVVRAALRVLPADLPAVERAAVWRSLVCNDTFDCPPSYLRDSPTVGSVIFAFTDGSPSIAVNVVDWRYGSSIRLGLRAWIARSMPVVD
jgi:hypothetical protein